jgi:hypothetical protein
MRRAPARAGAARLGRWNWYLPRWLAWLPRLEIEAEPASTGTSASADSERREAA